MGKTVGNGFIEISQRYLHEAMLLSILHQTDCLKTKNYSGSQDSYVDSANTPFVRYLFSAPEVRDCVRVLLEHREKERKHLFWNLGLIVDQSLSLETQVASVTRSAI